MSFGDLMTGGDGDGMGRIGGLRGEESEDEEEEDEDDWLQGDPWGGFAGKAVGAAKTVKGGMPFTEVANKCGPGVRAEIPSRSFGELMPKASVKDSGVQGAEARAASTHKSTKGRNVLNPWTLHNDHEDGFAVGGRGEHILTPQLTGKADEVKKNQAGESNAVW